MRTRRLIGAALMGVLLVLSLTVAAQTPGPYAAQVQQAIRSLLAGTAGSFTTVTVTPSGSARLQMGVPTGVAVTPSQLGTDLAAGAYTITVTSLDPATGQTSPPTEVTCTVTAGGTGRCAVAWDAVQGSFGYRVWTSLADVATPTRYFAVASTLTSYNLDTLTGATVATLPTANTAYRVSLGTSVGNWFHTPVLFPSSAYLNFGSTSGTTGYGIRDNAGTIELKSSGGAWASAGGAPTDATYITQTASGGLSAEQALSTLSTGLMQVTTTTGAITSVTTSAGLAGLISDETGSGAVVFGTAPVFTTSATVGAIATQSVLKFLPVNDATPFTYTIAAPDLAADAALTLAAGNTTLVAGTMVTSGATTLASLANISTALATGALQVTTTTGALSVLAPTDDNVMVGSGALFELKALTDCDAATSAVTYDTTTNAWGCNTIAAGTTLPVALSGNVTAAAWTTTGAGFSVAATTLTDNTTAAAGTVAVRAAHSFGAPTLAFSHGGANATIADAFTLYVPKPIAGTGAAITRANSAYFEGNVFIGVTQNGTIKPKALLDISAASTAAEMSISGEKNNTDGAYGKLAFSNYSTFLHGLASISAQRVTDDYGTALYFSTGKPSGSGGSVGNEAVHMTLDGLGVLGLYNNYTASNYEGATFTADGAGNFTFAAATLGTGTDNVNLVLTPAGTGGVVTPLVYGSTTANGDITIRGTSDATATTSYVILGNTGTFGVAVGRSTAMSMLHVENVSALTTYGAATVASQGITVVNANNSNGAPYGIQFGGYAGFTFGGIYGVGIDVLTGNTKGDIVVALRAATGDTTFTELARFVAGSGLSVGVIATQDMLKLLPVTSATRFTGILTVADLTTADKTYTFPNLSGTVALMGGVQNGTTFDATGFLVGGTAGIDKTCGGPVISMTVTKGLITALTCTS